MEGEIEPRWSGGGWERPAVEALREGPAPEVDDLVDDLACEVARWLRYLRRLGGGLLSLARPDGACVLCHLADDCFVGEASGGFDAAEREVRRRAGALARLGWLPPGEDSPRWTRRWLAPTPLWSVAGELVQALHAVAGHGESTAVLHVGPCGDPACVVHAGVRPGWAPTER